MIPVLSVELMRQSDARTIETSVPGRELMHRAGEAIFRAGNWKSPAAVVCGSGNNAGDGYVLAEYLREAGHDVTVFLLSDRFTEDGGYFADRCRAEGIPLVPWSAGTDLSRFASVADCIFGTGFRGAPAGAAREAIRAINESGAYVVSADINSGLDGDTGMAEIAVRSDLTVAIGFFKPGHFLNMAKDLMKEKVAADIGIRPLAGQYGLFEARDAAEAFPRRLNFSNKSDYGYIALIGGSKAYGGAVRMAALASAAMRSGAGVTKIAAPECIASDIRPLILESTLFPLPDRDGGIRFDEGAMEALLRGVRSAAFGMGAGGGEEIEKTLLWLLGHYTGTLVIDADGLNAVSRLGAEVLDRAACRVILTPHNMEFARMLRAPDGVAGVLRDPVGLARSFAREHGVTVLLKGPATTVTDGERTVFTDRGCPGMATAGSGDVLSGILAALCGSVRDPLTAAAAAAWVNGAAGELAQAEYGPVSMTAGDTVGKLPEVIRSLTEGA